MDAGGLERPRINESVQNGSLIGANGVGGSQMSDSQLVGVSGQAVNRVEQSHMVALTGGMNLGAPVVGPVGQLVEKRKRGRPSKRLTPNPRPPPPKRRIKELQEEEDVCFICFDGGHLVLCDFKGCPKAYHITCIKREESFFSSTSIWNCGWHICSVCFKNAHYKCYTCTYSLCKKCNKDTEYFCVRGNNGFCATCMKTIMLIENEDGENKEKVDFDDPSSWEYLFKVYWMMLKQKLSLTMGEVKQARNLARGVFIADINPPQPLQISAENGTVPNVPNLDEHPEANIVNEQVQLPVQYSPGTENPSVNKSSTLGGSADWASKEVLEFVAHIKNGDTAVLSHFDVQALLMEYIKTNNLCDPRRKSQIICDARLEKLFGKPCVGHMEMLKLLEHHFPNKEDTLKQSLIPVGNHVCVDQHNSPVVNQTRRLKSRSRREGRTPQISMSDYAAIDVHNISLVFLRRSMLENLIADMEKFHDKVVGSLVRIKVSTNDLKHDMFRLVQVVGTGKGSEPYKLGDKMTDIMVDVLNLNKKETMSIVEISEQDFSEDECKRLRQSIKFGLVKQLTVGEIQRKAISLQAEKLDDWLAAEISRLNQLRDQAIEKRRKKEIKECTEKLQILKTPEERQRRLCLYPEVHADPTMHPDYNSENDAAGEDELSRVRHSSLNNSGNQSIHPKRGETTAAKDDEPISCQQSQEKTNGGRSDACVQDNHVTAGVSSTVPRSDSVPAATVAFPMVNPPSINTSETETIWSYRDPSCKIQGPFSLAQLRKWSTSGYFPADLTIWNGNEQDRRSVLLTDALTEKIPNLSLSREVGNAVDNTVQALGNGTASANRHVGVSQSTDSTIQVSIVQEFDKSETRSFNNADQSSQQNQRSVHLNLDLNDHGSSVTNPCKPSEQKDDQSLLDLSSSAPKTNIRNIEQRSSEHKESPKDEIRLTEVQGPVSIDIHSKAIGIPDQLYHIPNPVDQDLQKPSSAPPVKGDIDIPACKPTDECHGQQIAVNEQPLLSKIPTEDLGWNASGQDLAGGRMQGIEIDWAAEPNNFVTAQNSNQQPAANVVLPNWLSMNEQIEFSTLGEESVSDLLAEYDAMETHSGLGSPTSAARCVDDLMDRTDCFSSIEDMSPAHDAAKSDALSSTADIPFPSLAAVMDDLFGTPDAEAFDPLKVSGTHSTTSSEGETKSADATTTTMASPWEAGPGPGPGPGPDKHPSVPCTMMSQVMGSTNMDAATWAVNVQGSMNMNVNLNCAGPPPQNFVNVDWGVQNPGTTWMDPNFNAGGGYNGNVVGWNNQQQNRYSGGDRFGVSRDWPFQGGEMGFSRAGSRPTWGGRQSHGGGGGGGGGGSGSGGYSRQRVCKFYENGHCRKGASCDYLHPQS